MYLLVREGSLDEPGSDPARNMEQDLDRLGFLDARRFEEAWIGEHFTARWENIPRPVRTSSWRQR
jgi:hypothetical protein